VPNLWDDPQAAQVITSKLSRAQSTINKISSIRSRLNDLPVMVELSASESDKAAAFKDVDKELDELTKVINDLEVQTLLSGEYDERDALMTIRSEAGGVEAADWAQMLMRMYVRYCERHNYKIDVLETSYAEEAGIKSTTFRISSPYAYGRLSVEQGTHRLVRISPFDSQSRRHTSFAGVEVVPVVYDSTSGNVVAAYANINFGSVRGVVFTVNASSFTMGSPVVAFSISGAGVGCPIAITKDTVNNKIVIAGFNSSEFPTAIVGTVSGTSISFGTETVITASTAAGVRNRGIGLAYSPVAQKVMACVAITASAYWQLAVGTVSGTSISFGTPADTTAERNSYYGCSGLYNASATNIIFMVGTLAIIVTAISGTTFTSTTSAPFSTTLNGLGALSIYAPNNFLILTTGANSSNFPSVTGFTAYSSTLTTTNLLGVSSSAYTNGQTATIQTVGSTNSMQSGLTAGLKYYVSPDGTLSTSSTSQPYAGLALSATKLVIKG
jgi:hypothetical protein